MAACSSFWAHLACLIPVVDWPLYRVWITPEYVLDAWRREALGRYPELAERVRAEIRERGPLTSRDFDGRGGSAGGMWNWKPAKMVLEALWNTREVVIASRVSGFQRLYDLPERVLPREVLEAPVPDPDQTGRGRARCRRRPRAAGGRERRRFGPRARRRGPRPSAPLGCRAPLPVRLRRTVGLE